MTRKLPRARSVVQRVSNQGKERGLSRDDAFTAYTMDRLLYRLGRSAETRELYLKGGVLVATIIGEPHRFTRDIDLLRRRGPPDPEDLRKRLRSVIAVSNDDGVTFDPKRVRATRAERETDGYDGVKVSIGATVGDHPVEVGIDVGFGDAVVPRPSRLELTPFLPEDVRPSVVAYAPGPILAEKVETLLSKFPVIEHRLKDLLDVVALAETGSYRGQDLTASLRATFKRRRTPADLQVLDDMADELKGRKWERAWNAMLREKVVAKTIGLGAAVAKFDAFVRPLIIATNGSAVPGRWTPGGPWRSRQ